MRIRMTAAAVLAGAALVAGAGAAAADSGASGSAVGSPGVLSGNVIQVPIDIPLNLCGNSLNLVGLLNPTAGAVCANG
ncbi:chaplin [Streptomyces tropicalis]|uniref:Chaplin n=1 Tax=Streptomyces tropicalis TaxID=3034234 RepID=A0ABT6AA67_9ACTN|nr:chaplin [Streptomyces tropicalis]MDF3301542.1 chaplin [Streptomyces tropicalis]